MAAAQPIYLDNNATTRPYSEAVEAMSRCFREQFANPGSRHASGRKARQALEEARERIAQILNAEPGEVVFTSGGTESINMAIFGLTLPHYERGIEGGQSDSPLAKGEPAQSAQNHNASSRPPEVPLRKGDGRPTIALTAGEHPATMESCRHLERQGWRLHRLDVDSDGRLVPEQYDDLPWDDLKLVTVILAHNETGVVQDLHPLAETCRERGVPFHVDAVQAVGKIPVDFRELGVTSLALGAHKFHGPRGIGALLLRDGTKLRPYLFGGHQESERRPGTEPVALAVGMAEALKTWNAHREEWMRRIRDLRDRLERGLSETCAPVVVNGSGEHRLPNTLNISFPGVEGEPLLVNLDLEGIACSLGSTCASGSAEPAPILMAMGRPPEVYESAVRFSLSIENTPEEIDEAVRRISGVVERLRQTAPV